MDDNREVGTEQVAAIYNLELFSDGKRLAQLTKSVFGSDATDCRKIGAGFYADVYRVRMSGAMGSVIAKCHRHPGIAGSESRQLAVLKEHSLVSVPTVYDLQTYSEDCPCDLIFMEDLPGMCAADVQFQDERTQSRFVDMAVENLKAWHSVHHDGGFGGLDGPFYPSWAEALFARITRYMGELREDRHRAVISEYVMGVIETSYAEFQGIFSGACSQPSLVHSDYNAWNMLVDPCTYELSGVIDPIDAGWADPEIDLFHLPNCRPELGLLAKYLEGRETDDAFQMRYHFYRFWDDIKHYLRMGWYEEERFSEYAKALESDMKRLL